jgi:hypothetical protein
VPIARSFVGIRYHDGIVRHAGGPDGSLRVASAAGRCARAIALAVRGGTSAAKISRNTPSLMGRAAPPDLVTRLAAPPQRVVGFLV